ncbi:hypothetical protein [Aliiruegeria lutimaris]|uniref:Muramidase (Phage lambda lysozyme) n=1 Tax=Aliiruegeria lutimaris TaxID=571298 RepID=A0A1G8P6Y6_9RHOB|nr:hypothetical protein [Aliiruegeria lutimaris]SDI88259.1 hypothetical protein SAMN04488026_100888 [Aliiruegeria lutimaris]
MFPVALIPALALVLAFCVPQGVLAEAMPRQRAGSVFGGAGAIVPVVHRQASGNAGQNAASLFSGRDGTSLFALVPKPAGSPVARGLVVPLGGWDALRKSSAGKVLQLIAQAEAGAAGYDAVQLAAKIRPPRRPTRMTIGEIYAWIEQTPGQQHAIGRYQFIPKTLRRLVRELGVGEDKLFSPNLQDALAMKLLEEAGFGEFQQSEISRHQFMNNLARIWAGLPTSSGKSHYHGLSGNRATMSWARFDAQMAKIFPG